MWNEYRESREKGIVEAHPTRDRREPFVSLKEVLEHVGVDRKTFRRALQTGRLRRHYLPGSNRPKFKLSEIDADMAAEARNVERMRRADALGAKRRERKLNLAKG